MAYLASLRNYDYEGNINISLWSSKDKMNLEQFSFVDEQNNEYQILNHLLSDTNLSLHLKLKPSIVSNIVNVSIKLNGVEILKCNANKNINKIYSVSCDFPDKNSTNMWEKLHNDESTLLLHLGDQLYADITKKAYYAQPTLTSGNVYEWQEECEKITIDNFFSGCGNKYLTGWHEFLWDDHEVDNGFRTDDYWFNNWENHPHTEGAINAYSQCQLGKQNSLSTRIINYNKINVLLIDQRTFMTFENVKNGSRWLPDNHINLINQLLSSIDLEKQLFVCISGAYHSTTPLADLKVFLESKFEGKKSEIDTGASTQNAPLYSKLIEILDSYEFKISPIIIGGDIHMAAIKNIISKKRIYKHLISSGVRSPSKNYEPLKNKIIYFLERNFEIDNRFNKNVKVDTIYQDQNKNIGLIQIKDTNIEISFISESNEKKVII